VESPAYRHRDNGFLCKDADKETGQKSRFISGFEAEEADGEAKIGRRIRELPGVPQDGDGIEARENQDGGGRKEGRQVYPGVPVDHDEKQAGGEEPVGHAADIETAGKPFEERHDAVRQETVGVGRRTGRIEPQDPLVQVQLPRQIVGEGGVVPAEIHNMMMEHLAVAGGEEAEHDHGQAGSGAVGGSAHGPPAGQGEREKRIAAAVHLGPGPAGSGMEKNAVQRSWVKQMPTRMTESRAQKRV
jgi:hypothetical protein